MKKLYLFLLFNLFTVLTIGAQSTFTVMFYNVENFFDTIDEPGKDDKDFLPDGSKHWTYGRYKNKLNNISKVISSVGEWTAPAIVGMCEVENETVMDDLTKNSPIKSLDYRYVITKCADQRGINVALMYQRDQFKYLKHDVIKIKFPDSPKKKTRDILYVSGQVVTGDTLDIFICHFPSRRGGEQETEAGRVQVATVLKSKADSLMKVRTNPNILIMGDFNDEPSDKSIYETLKARSYAKNPGKKSLYNLFYKYQKQEGIGTYKYGNQWNVLDQMIVSGNLLDNKRKFHVKPETAEIFQRDFLMIQDKSNGGKRPKKTYRGPKHEGGFSDHLPIVVEFSVTSRK